MLLDGHRNRKEAQILHIKSFGHILERLSNVAAIGGFIRDHPELRRKRVLDFLGDNRDGTCERVADTQRPHHQFDRIRQLFFDQVHAFFSFGRDPEIDRPDPDPHRDQDTHGNFGAGPDGQAQKGDNGQPGHNHDQLFRRKGNRGFLRFRGEHRIDGNGFVIHMLLHFLAQLVQNLFAAGSFFQHFQPAVDLAVEADGFTEGDQVQPFDQHEDTDKDQAINNGFCAHD